MRRVIPILVLLVVLAMAGPQASMAAEAPVSTEVHTVSGLELASQFVGGVSDVELASDGATVTVDVDGRMIQMPVQYSSLLGDQGDLGGGSMLLLFAGGTLFLRFLGLLMRLGR